MDIVAINELANAETICHLTKYDSTHGRFPVDVELSSDCLRIDGQSIKILHTEELDKLRWSELNVDMVLECTGSFSDRDRAKKHLERGAFLRGL